METQNCVPDNDDILNLIRMSNIKESTTSKFVSSSAHEILNIPNHESFHDFEENALKYVCDYLIKKCTAIHPCDMCTKYENKVVIR